MKSFLVLATPVILSYCKVLEPLRSNKISYYSGLCSETVRKLSTGAMASHPLSQEDAK